MDALTTYLRELRATRASGAIVKETSHYPALKTLFNTVGCGLKPRVQCEINVRNQGAGLPDGGFFTPDQLRDVEPDRQLDHGPTPARGVLEVKGTGDDLDAILRSEQVRTYWQRYGQVLVTNLRDFALVGRDPDGDLEILERYKLTVGEQTFWASDVDAIVADHGEAFAEYLKRVMLHAAPLTTPKDVAWFLASYARDAKTRVDRAKMPALGNLRAAMEEALGLRFEGEQGEAFFRSTLVQTLFYGVFSAWVLWSKRHPPASATRFNWHDAEYELRVPMIRALFEQIAMGSRVESLGLVEVLDWTEAALNRVDRDRFFAAFDEGEAVQYFYEPFLEQFDPALRKQLGVWYTPTEIVRYMVERVDTVLREELGLADGLADPNVVVLDPCTGTGSYLVEVLRRIGRTLAERGDDALAAHTLKRAAIGRVFGFEILPAPFVVAHLQLGLLLQGLGAPLAAGERAGVFLTNALTGWDEPPAATQKLLAFPELEQERDAAEEVKRERRVLVVLGNPPYNAFAGVSPRQEAGLVEPYKRGLNTPVAQGGWGIKKFNLDDLYVRFFRLAERRIAEQTGQGIVCYISNFSYLSDPSFVVMRQRFLKEFDALWFDSLNGDSRETGKLTPEGKPDPSVFSTPANRAGIRVGTAVGLMVRKPERDPEPTVRFRQFWGTTKREDLLGTLDNAGVDRVYEAATPSASNRYSFRPTGGLSDYASWPLLIALSTGTMYQGLAEDRRKALIDDDPKQLSRRLIRYFDSSVSWQTLEAEHGALTDTYVDFPAAEVRRSALAKGELFKTANVVRYAMRPFDNQWCYYTSLRPIWRRHRPDYFAQVWEENSFIVSRFKPASAAEGSPLAYVSGLSDYHFLKPNVAAIPIRLRDPVSSGANDQWQPGLFSRHDDESDRPSANLSPAARAYLTALGDADPDADAESAGLIWMHALAIGYAPAYLSEHADGLRQDWPRIPLPADKGTLLASAALGREVAALLDTESPVPGVTSGALRPELRRIGGIASAAGKQLDPDAGDLAVTAGWGHAGRAGVTMPGRGRLVERAYAPEEEAAIRQGALALGLDPNDAIARLGETTTDIFLNDDALWRNVPINVWGFIIGGYQVVKKWLSYREADLLGRPLTAAEAKEVSEMVRRLAALRLLEPALDANYRRAAAATSPWPTPQAPGT